ncbi:MAG: peptide ABC transporter substrate-binding protein, partial [Parvibaculaceae bacterium]
KIEQLSYDPDKSKFYLKRAGLSCLDVELDAADVFPGALDLALLAAHSEGGAGVNVNVKRVPKDGYWDEVWMKRPWCLSAWKGRPTTDWVLSYAFSSSSPNNESFWKNEKFDDLLLKARTELDEGKRFQMYSDAQALVSGESGVIIPCFANMLMAASDKLVHGEVSGATELDNFRLAETWSFG